ncbi:hypothetical protein MLD38_006504 [Melastoma candidum]|uniref:Uncharacterized protein n=1 Tax=Melastoma candidum TaxID=119954 RepID=A0ACB9RSB0_9MYRT|nr:hypothetical protein MLD38_006504 [Melastoma candidum]
MTIRKIKLSSIISSCYRLKEGDAPLPEPEERDVIKCGGAACRLSLSDFSCLSSQVRLGSLLDCLERANIRVFTLSELRLATRDFSRGNFLGEGGFGPVHKGLVGDGVGHESQNLAVAVKSLDRNGSQGHREWLTEIIFLGQLRHPNLVRLIGLCCEDEHRLLVYEYMEKGSLENVLLQNNGLPWTKRMNIALRAAKGLAFLHDAEKPVIFRDFKASNILLNSDYDAKLSDFGLAKDGPEGGATHVSTRVMGTYGYVAPEYILTGHLTTMSDVFSFGVVLLELITGRRSMDRTRPRKEQDLVEWAMPMLKASSKLETVIDRRLEGEYPLKEARIAAILAYKCCSKNPDKRPGMTQVVKILESIQGNQSLSPCLGNGDL